MKTVQFYLQDAWSLSSMQSCWRDIEGQPWCGRQENILICYRYLNFWLEVKPRSRWPSRLGSTGVAFWESCFRNIWPVHRSYCLTTQTESSLWRMECCWPGLRPRYLATSDLKRSDARFYIWHGSDGERMSPLIVGKFFIDRNVSPGSLSVGLIFTGSYYFSWHCRNGLKYAWQNLPIVCCSSTRFRSSNRQQRVGWRIYLPEEHNCQWNKAHVCIKTFWRMQGLPCLIASALCTLALVESLHTLVL